MKKLCLSFFIVCYVLCVAAIIVLIYGIIAKEISIGTIITLILSIVSSVINGALFLWRYKEEIEL